MSMSNCRGLLAAVSFCALTIGLVPAVTAQETAALSADAELAAKGAWSATATYAKDDIVTARGSSWISLKANNKNHVPGQTNPSSNAWWRLFARGFNPAGAWSSATKYQPDDLVTFSGQTWRAKITNNNKQPAANANWELLAQKGAIGATGPAGADGATGPTGPAGPNTGIDGGSASAPGISFNGDPNTGIFSPVPGEIALVRDGDLFLHGRGSGNTAFGLRALPLGAATSNNTAIGFEALFSNDSGVYNTAIGHTALRANTSGNVNVAIGPGALSVNTEGGNNVAVLDALGGNTAGSRNLGIGSLALLLNQTGSQNVALGGGALQRNGGGGGSDNIAIGYRAGFNVGFSGGPRSNGIFIGNQGANADENLIRLGTAGTHNKTFISGISGVTTDVGDAVAVVIDSAGQLGIQSSSRRYKYDIETMADVSAMLGKLRPVTFRYKQAQNGGAHPLQYGLIAEEVAETFPDLAVFNKDGSAETVKYHLLPSFLLAGYQAQQKKIAAQADELRQQKEINASLEARLARLEAMLPRVTRAAAAR